MKRLSLWAKSHKQAARISIVISFMLLTVLGIITGRLLSGLGIVLSSAIMSFFIAGYLLGIIAYPSKSLKGKKISAHAFYIRQKSCDLLLAGSTFCMLIFLSNRPDRLFNGLLTIHAASIPIVPASKDSSIKTYKSIRDFAASLKDGNGKPLAWKLKKQLLKEQVRAIKKADNMSKGDKAGLIILSVIVALGLLFLVGALACNISCNGSEGAAIVVTVLGAGLVVFLFILALRSINGKKKIKARQDAALKRGKKSGTASL